MNIFRRLCLKDITKIIQSEARCYSGGLYEPHYLDEMKSKTPLYDTLNIILRGYDYPILENYQKQLHNLLKNMEIDVEESWAIPPQHIQISTYKPKSDLVQSQFLLKTYERIIQITDVPSIQLPIIIRVIEAGLPAGVSVNIRPHEEADEENRYIPDSELNALKSELEELGGPSKKK
ncbi:unnamed protein product [Acanthoscelides obtectus]|uniref:Small ribosomal subunit protein uS10 domain-containing protein n=1 Tax=Acanthoscelides obtectus TaxID=200917 RepID=A0A9P0MHY6_ACAOB|nr:unnamed protein product [Acanthoscelides obtectus]CAK1672525.1 39S ribosomal protein L48, mitochondrial [Acanthoscelides obtectus]